MIKIFRFSSFLAVVVIITKTGLFVANEFDGKADRVVIHKITRLIDEAMRRRGEIEEATDSVVAMAEAISVSVVRAIVWMARGRAALANRARGVWNEIVGDSCFGSADRSRAANGSKTHSVYLSMRPGFLV
ncbi:hypothetical protein NRY68_17050 [Acidithiobacillus ferrooxidans]|jgi:hypothetical protein|uniref:hypothetical protein n=1 Tax=Acidithiobacillus ferrooxidans TaxID=920 RepID=UPI002147C716|nr:hypothetical protein [Acidithiobacillus ferrooxidans]MCR1347460.1 hypothetical protein [Acidithiobacillus ferrooxidans]MCR1355197.1 hypothetical protein [Acidithiobacillus ferrooxidans]MDA8376174.1 hypothetical protein [Planctomycetia bacterium]